MESGVPNAEYEGDQPQAQKMRGAILHPLASITIERQKWLNQLQLTSNLLNHSSVSSSPFTEAGNFQSVHLDESVYFSERVASSYSNKCVLHKCNMKTQDYYKLPTKVEGYALAVYQSKVVMIGGSAPSTQNQGRSTAPNDDPKYPISILDDDCGLEERLKSALDKVPQGSRHAYSEIGQNACAVGEEDLLIVIGTDDNAFKPRSRNVEYVRIFDGQNWSYGIIGITGVPGGYSCDIRSMQKTVLVFQNHIYMAAYKKYSRVHFGCISLECLKNQHDRNSPLWWNLLGDVPDGALCTNLSVLGNQLVTIGVIDGGFRMYAYLAESSKWIAVHEFQLTDIKSVTGIIGLQSSNSPSDQEEALLVGVLPVGAHYHRTTVTRIYKLTTKSQPYNSDNEVEFLALLKLEELTNIPVLTAIENNAEKFVDTAGFKLVHSRRRKVRIAYEYIEGWKQEKIKFYEPTWTGLFTVLRQIGLNSLATSIDVILSETSPSIEQGVECEDPDNAMDMLVKLKESLTELSKAEPSDLQTGAIACASKCDKVLQKFKVEKADTERELESRKANIEKLTSELTLCRESIHDQPPGAKYRCIDASDKHVDSPVPKLKDLLKELYKKVAGKWEVIGIMLDIDDGELSKVKSDNAGNSGNCLQEMLKIWVKKVDPKPSWSSMADALDDLGEESLAEHIRKTYCSTC